MANTNEINKASVSEAVQAEKPRDRVVSETTKKIEGLLGDPKQQPARNEIAYRAEDAEKVGKMDGILSVLRTEIANPEIDQQTKLRIIEQLAQVSSELLTMNMSDNPYASNFSSAEREMLSSVLPFLQMYPEVLAQHWAKPEKPSEQPTADDRASSLGHPEVITPVAPASASDRNGGVVLLPDKAPVPVPSPRGGAAVIPETPAPAPAPAVVPNAPAAQPAPVPEASIAQPATPGSEEEKPKEAQPEGAKESEIRDAWMKENGETAIGEMVKKMDQYGLIDWGKGPDGAPEWKFSTEKLMESLSKLWAGIREALVGVGAYFGVQKAMDLKNAQAAVDTAENKPAESAEKPLDMAQKINKKVAEAIAGYNLPDAPGAKGFVDISMIVPDTVISKDQLLADGVKLSKEESDGTLLLIDKEGKTFKTKLEYVAIEGLLAKERTEASDLGVMKDFITVCKENNLLTKPEAAPKEETTPEKK